MGSLNKALLGFLLQVIHYEIPNDPETFVHRSGRTARAGKTGTAILMYTESQIRTLKRIERDVNSKFERISAPHVDDVLLASTQQAMASIEQVFFPSFSLQGLNS